MTTIVVTGADEAFAPMLLDLVASLNASEQRPFDAIGVLDVGLSKATVEQLRPKVSAIVEPDWDFVIDPALRQAKPHLRAILSRPFLRKYFPGHSRFIWMDADTWVQDGFALRWLVRASTNGTMALVPHTDRSYTTPEGVGDWKMSRLNAYFPGELPSGLLGKSYNAGVFGLESRAPHWSAWASYMKVALGNSPTTISDQTVLNYALVKDKLPVHALPALCNWCCHLAVPGLRKGLFCEPFIPHATIGILHLSGVVSKNFAVEYVVDGRRMRRSLRYGGTMVPGDRVDLRPDLGDPAQPADGSGAL